MPRTQNTGPEKPRSGLIQVVGGKTYGSIIVSRVLFHRPISRDRTAFADLRALIDNAYHSDGKARKEQFLITIRPGQNLYTKTSLHRIFGCNKDNVQKRLDSLVALGEIRVIPLEKLHANLKGRGLLIEVVDYDFYTCRGDQPRLGQYGNHQHSLYHVNAGDFEILEGEADAVVESTNSVHDAPSPREVGHPRQGWPASLPEGGPLPSAREGVFPSGGWSTALGEGAIRSKEEINIEEAKQSI